jgi:hypothetical protein
MLGLHKGMSAMREKAGASQQELYSVVRSACLQLPGLHVPFRANSERTRSGEDNGDFGKRKQLHMLDMGNERRPVYDSECLRREGATS